MVSRIVRTAVVLSLSATMAFAMNTLRFNVVEGDANEAFKSIIELDLADIEFTPKDIHPGVDKFYRQFYEPKLTDKGEANLKYDPNFVMNLDNLGFITIASEPRMREILLKAPQLGGFAPLNYLIYKKKSENKTYVGFPTAEAMLAITKTTDPKVVKEFTAMIDDLAKVTDSGIGGEVVYRTTDKLQADTMMEFEIPFDRAGDIMDAKFNFMEKFEKLFEENNYIIAGKRDFAEYYADNGMEFDRFDHYWVYSLCHFKFSYTIFNVGKNPEAGAFAPCSMYMYIEKGSNVLKVGMPNVTNWISIANIKDPKMIEEIQNMDKKIVSLMKELGAVEK